MNRSAWLLTRRHMHFRPAGMEMWGYSADTRFVKDATLTFDLAASP